MRKRLFSFATFGIVAMVVLTACGSPDEDEEAHDVTRVPVTFEAAATPAEAAPEAAAEGEAAGEAAATELTIVMGQPTELEFDPSEVTIPANTEVTITLPNEGAAPHNFTVDALGVSVDANPGETATVTLTAEPGEYEFYCNVPGHKEGGMVGVLRVVEGGGEAAAPAEGEAAASPGASPAPAGAATAAASPAAEEASPVAAEATAAASPAGTPDATPEGSPVADGGPTGDVVRGQQLAAQCLGCHSVDGSQLVGPTWQGLYGSTETLTTGETVEVDHAYLVESIVDPNAKVVEGYPANVMPSYSYLSEQDINDLVAYIESLK